VCCAVLDALWDTRLLNCCDCDLVQSDLVVCAKGGKSNSSSLPGHCQHDYECVVGCHRSSGCCCCILRSVVIAAAAVELLKLVMILG
jgi:hypothetical protein